MPAIRFDLDDVPVIISARSPRLIDLFTDYFRYYHPQPAEGRLGNDTSSGAWSFEARGALKIELKTRRFLPPLARLVPPGAELLSQTGVVRLWQEPAKTNLPERFYFHMGTTALRLLPERGYALGLVTPQALNTPHVLANTYALFALLLLLRPRGLYHLHAAAVLSPRDKLYLICGEPHAGKTTLTTALGLAGWRPISDDSLLIHADGPAAQLIALKKSFHISNDVLDRWDTLDTIARHYRYTDRTCAAGLEFFGTLKLAEAKFGRVDTILLPQITGGSTSRLAPIPVSEAILQLATQSMFFQLWREHTQPQLKLLAQLASTSSSYRLLAGTDILANPHCAAELLGEENYVAPAGARASTI